MLTLVLAAALAAPQATPTQAQPVTPSTRNGETGQDRTRRFRPPAIFGDRPPVRGYRPPVTIIYGPYGSYIGDEVVAFPFQFNLPAPAYGLVWMRHYNDAVLFDQIRGTILEVRQRWFG